MLKSNNKEWLNGYKNENDIRCLHETHFRSKDTHRLKVRGWKKEFHIDGNLKKRAGVAILTSD